LKGGGNMKRTLGVLLFVCVLIVNLNAEYPTAFQPGEKIVQAGLGFGVAGVYGDLTIPPISLSIDIAKEIEGYPISFGGLIGYTSSKDEYKSGTYWWKWTYSYLLIGARAAYHLKMESDKIDPYGGLMIGYYIVSNTFDDNFDDWWTYDYSAKSSYMAYGFYGGARYFFNPKMAVYAELGYGFGYLNLGLSFKL
jgi:hypothetical protein